MSTPENPRRAEPRPPRPAGPSDAPTGVRQPRAPAQVPPAYERLPPEPPPGGPWWENPWPAVAAGLVALLLGGVVGYLIGNSGTSERRTGPTQTVTNTRTVVHPKTVVQTQTVTSNTVKETPSPVNRTNEERRQEAEANLRKTEKENSELRRQLEEAGRAP